MTKIIKDKETELLSMLQTIQEEKGYIADSDMQRIAEELGISPVEVYSVVTFYSFLTIKPKGRHIIRVSNCVSCVMAGSEKIVEAFEKALEIQVGETTEDKKFTLEKTSCIGMCDQAPAILFNDELIGNINPEMVKQIIKDSQ